MAILENWGTAGTTGVLGWSFGLDTAVIGTYDGTTVLNLPRTDSANLLYKVAYDGVGSFTARVYSDYSGLAYLNANEYLLAENSAGTELYLGFQMWSSFRGTFFERCDGVNAVLDTGQVTEATNGIYHTLTVEQSGGTIYGTVYNGTTAANFTAAGWTFDEDIIPKITDTSSLLGLSHIDYVSWPYTRYTILDFIGTYDDGTSVGTVNLGDDVITMGGVSEVGFIPYVSQGWAATIPVTIDDTGSAWTGLCGDMSNPTFLEGTYFVKQKWNGTWNTLRTCYAEAGDIQYDYGKKIASVTLHDILGRYAEKTFPMDGTSNLVQQSILGTVYSAGGGTVSVRSVFNHDTAGQDFVQFTEGATLWKAFGSDGDRIQVGSAFRYDQYGQGSWTDSYYGTFGISGSVPSWIVDMVAGGEVLYITQSWPSGYDVSQYDRPSAVVRAIIGEWGLSSPSRTDYQYMDYWNIDWGKKYYGGDKYKDALNDVCAGCMSSYTLDGDGAPTFYSDGPWSINNMGTIDFADAINDNWSVSYVPATKQVRVKAGWSEEDRKYTVEYLSESGTYSSGKVLTINAGWVRDNIDTEYMADRIALLRGVTRTVLTIPINGSRFLDYSPRYMYTILNIPASVPVVNDQWRLMGKTYDHKTDITVLAFESKRPHAGYFTWNQSVWNGSDSWW